MIFPASKYKLELTDSNIAPWMPKAGADRQIAVMMSGGVDSSVSAYLLKEAGWDVAGITMRIPAACRSDKRGCCGADAAYVSAQLGISHFFVDVTEPFNELIIERFRQAYSSGLTPNPCADCNSFLKFRIVWDLIEKELGIKHLATGHYARVQRQAGAGRIFRGADRKKDQSYFLYGIPIERVNYFHLPVGDLSKDKVRETAGRIGLGTAEKSESMELCFAGEGDYRRALGDAGADRPGKVLDRHGNVIGEHKGTANFTIGQRRGLGYAAGEPVYVAAIDPQANTVTLAPRSELMYKTVKANEVNVLDARRLKAGQRLWGKIRSGGEPAACTVRVCGEDEFEVEFDRSVFAPAPGQKLVVYGQEEQLVAGGTVCGFER